MNRESSPTFDPGRRWRVGFNVVVATALFLGVVLMLNYMTTKMRYRFDWSGADRFALSPLTEQVLREMTAPVKVTVLYDPERDESQSRLFGMVEGLLREYALRSGRIELRFVDGLRQAQLANALKAQYNLPSEAGDVVLFDSGGRSRAVYFSELSVYEGVGDFIRTREVRRAGFKGEERFTTAIVNVLQATRPKVCALQGHREHRLDSEDQVLGYQRFGRLLTEKNLEVLPISLANQDQAIPEDCRLLIVAGPQTPLLPEELEKIEQYLDQGGRLLLLTHPLNLARGEVTGFETLMHRWGVHIGRQEAGDSINTLNKVDVLTRNFASHPITSDLARSDGYLYFPQPRVIRRLPDALRSPEAPRAEHLVTTSTNGYTLSEYRDHAWYPSPRLDIRGEIPLAVAVEQGGLTGITANRGATRIVVIGDSSMFGNDAIGKGSNRDFGSLALEWLLDRPQFLAIGPKPVHEYRLNLTSRQLRTLRVVLIGLVPGIVLMMGMVVWLRRRS
jgi:hypothetical protein